MADQSKDYMNVQLGEPLSFREVKCRNMGEKLCTNAERTYK